MKLLIFLLGAFVLTAAKSAADEDVPEEYSLTPWNELVARSPEYDYDPPKAGTYELPAVKAAINGTVLGTNGAPVNLHDLFKGRIVILSFIYTRCGDPRACLRATGVLRQIQQMSQHDPNVAEKLLLLTLSFDPAYDTPEVMARYGQVSLSKDQTADWLFVTTRNKEELQPLLDAYGQRIDRRSKPSSLGPYSHPLRVYLIDPDRQIRNIYSFGLLDPRLVFTDIQTLFLEEKVSK